MIRKLFSLLALPVVLATIGAGQPTPVQVPGASFANAPGGSGLEVSSSSTAAADPIIYYYLSRWKWDDRSGIIDPITGLTVPPLNAWVAKYADSITGMIDMRTIPQQSTRGGADQCCMLASFSAPQSAPDLLYLGSDIDSLIQSGTRNAIRTLLGSEPLTRPTIAGLVREFFTLQSDPAGQSGVRPFIPNGRRVITATIGGKRLFTDQISTGSVEWVKAVTALQIDYDDVKAENPELALKLAGWWLEKYGFDVRTIEQQADGITLPETTIGPLSFTDTDGVELSVHDANWTEVVDTADVTILSNQAYHDQDVVGGNSRYVYDGVPLSGNDNWAEAIHGMEVGVSEFMWSTVWTRGNSGGTSFYEVRIQNNDTSQLFKNVSGVFTQIGTDQAAAQDRTKISRVTADGSDITHSFDGSILETVSDSAISTGLHVGIRGFTFSSARDPFWDDFQAQDLAAAAARRIFIFVN